MPGKSFQCMQKPGIVFSLYDRHYCVVKNDASIASLRRLHSTLDGSLDVRRFYEPTGRHGADLLCVISPVCV